MVKHICLAVIISLVLTGCERKLDTFQQLVQELDETEKEIRVRQDEIREMVHNYNASHPDGDQVDAFNIERMLLDPDEVDLLNRMLENEQDVSYRGLLSEIVDDHTQIIALQERLRRLQDQLPAPYTVQVGDTHRDVSLRYLMENHKMPIREAREVIDKTALVEEMYTGYQIWMLYQNGVFGSYVTQGTASVSPGRAQRQAKQRVARKIEALTDERDVARIQADSLQELHDTLRERLIFLRNEESRLQTEIAVLKQAHDTATARVEMSEQQRQMLEARLNSIFYEVDTMDRWKEKKVIADPLFGSPRVKSLAGVQFSQSHDLRENKILTFDLRDFPELKRFKQVDLFPRSFKAGQEYVASFDDDGDYVYVKILKPDVFAGQKIIFALR